MASYEARNASTRSAAGRTECGSLKQTVLEHISELDALVLLLTLRNATFPRYAWKTLGMIA